MPQARWLLCVAFLSLATPEFAALAQVVAEQGAPPADFHSPMILTVRFRDLSSVVPNSRFDIGFGDYWVDDVQLRRLTVRRSPDRKGLIQLAFEGSVYVRQSHDREVVAKFELLADGATIATWSTDRFDAEERKTSAFRFAGTLPADSTPNQMRATITVY